MDEAELAAELSPDSPYVLAVLSMAQRLESDPDGSLETAEEAISLDGEDAWALLALSQAQLEVGLIDEAFETAELAFEASKDVQTFAEAEMTMASSHSSKLEYDEAEDFAHQAYVAYGEFIPIILLRASYYSQNADDDIENVVKELELIEDALDRDPDFTRTLSYYASYYRGEEDYETALEYCDQVVELLPEHPSGYNCRGVTYIDSEQYELARESYELAIDRDLEDTGGYFGRGRVYFFEDSYADARGEFEKVLELYPYSPFTHVMIGYTHLREEETTAAIESFQTSLELDRYNPAALLALGRALAAEERYEEAEEQILAAVDLDDESANLYLDLGQIQSNLEKYEEADASFAKALELETEEAYVLVAYGDYLLDRNRHYDAQLQYQAALELDAESVQALVGLGYSYALQDNCGAAIGKLNEARDLDPDNFVAGELYQQCLRVYRYQNPPGVQGDPVNEPTAVTLAKNNITGRLGLSGDEVIVEFYGTGDERIMGIGFLTRFDPATQQGEINNQIYQAIIAATDAFARTDTAPLILAAEAYAIQGEAVNQVGSFGVHRTDAVDFWNGTLSEGSYIGKFN